MVNTKLEEHNEQLRESLSLLTEQLNLIKDINRKKSTSRDLSMDAPNFAFKRQ